MAARSATHWGEALPRPKAILSVSAHWLTPGMTAVDVQEHPRTIYDFGGFPPELYAIKYLAPGAPTFAREAAALIKQAKVINTSDWGLDHGTWTALHHMFPRADVPVFQLSIDYEKPGAYHLAVGRELAGLRDQGVLVLGSGNIVHNLRATDRGAPDSLSASRPWAAAFDAAVVKALTGRDDKALVNYAALDTSAAQAVPTPDHYFPLLYALGAAGPTEAARSVFEGFQAATSACRRAGLRRVGTQFGAGSRWPASSASPRGTAVPVPILQDPASCRHRACPSACPSAGWRAPRRRSAPGVED